MSLSCNYMIYLKSSKMTAFLDEFLCEVSVINYSQVRFMVNTKPQKREELDTKIKSENKY